MAHASADARSVRACIAAAFLLARMSYVDRLGLVGAALLALAVGGHPLGLARSSRRFGRYPHRGRGTDRLVALPFDDGPNEPYTSQIAHLLEGRRIRGTVFQVGRCVQRHLEVTTRLSMQATSSAITRSPA